MKSNESLGRGMVSTKTHPKLNYGHTVEVLNKDGRDVWVIPGGESKKIKMALSDVEIDWSNEKYK